MLMVFLLTYFPVLVDLAKESEQLLLINVLPEKVKHVTIFIASSIWPKPSGTFVSYLPPLLHLIKFNVNKVHVALKMHLTVSAIQVI
jgi:hypothetical protein